MPSRRKVLAPATPEVLAFRAEWEAREARFEKEAKPVHESTLHVHDDSCWTEPRVEEVEQTEKQGIQWTKVRRTMRISRCRVSGTIKEVPL